MAIRYYRTDEPIGWVTIAYAEERATAIRFARLLHIKLGIHTEIRISHNDTLAQRALVSWK